MEGSGSRKTELETLSSAWSQLRGNTLHKTLPQLLVAMWFWSLVIERRSLASAGPGFVVPIAAAVFFYGIVIGRVLRALPKSRFLIALLDFFVLVMGYTIWLGLVPPRDRDAREWLGWAAVASGLVATIVLVAPRLVRSS